MTCTLKSLDMWFSVSTLSIVVFVCTEANAGLSKRYVPQFSDGVKVATVRDSHVDEASGLCYSRLHPNVLYTHNDSGDRPGHVYVIDATNGRRLSTLTIDGAGSHDWEDIACGSCPENNGKWCIYIADTGGNVDHSENTIYRIREPDDIHGDQHVKLDSTLKFSWDQHNAETVMVDPTGEVYVVSKVHGGNGKMVKLPKSAWGSSHRVSANHGIHLDLDSSRNDPVGGDISPTGYEVLIKTIEHVNYYYIPDGDYLKHMTQRPIQLPYTRERQGEAIAWDAHVRGYYTLGEGDDQPLYFYERKMTDAIFG